MFDLFSFAKNCFCVLPPRTRLKRLLRVLHHTFNRECVVDLGNSDTNTNTNTNTNTERVNIDNSVFILFQELYLLPLNHILNISLSLSLSCSFIFYARPAIEFLQLFGQFGHSGIWPGSNIWICERIETAAANFALELLGLVKHERKWVVWGMDRKSNRDFTWSLANNFIGNQCDLDLLYPPESWSSYQS